MPETKLKVILLRYTPAPEEIVSMAAKLCYSPSDITALREKIEAKDQKVFVEKLVKMGHMTPIEHTSFTFAIEGISRACSHQLVRHRLASYSQQSQRYVSEASRSDPSVESTKLRPALGSQPPKASLAKGGKADIKEVFDYVIPLSIAENPDAKRTFEDFMFEAQKTYDFLIAKLNEKGIKGEVANQDARFILPNAAETKIMVTMNARELLHFFRQRCCYRAQWEIRQMAEEMLKLVKNVAPTIFYKAGPGCLYAPCPEGEYYCGKIKEVRERYGVKPSPKHA